jgi:hypothetical protein
MNAASSAHERIRLRIHEARERSPALSSDTFAQLEAFLTGDLAQQHIPSKKIAEIAEALLAEAPPRASQ